ncbi:MAG: hypothetical protein WDA59_01675 [Methanofastidiosum sp.]
MTLIISDEIRVYCPICDWYKIYHRDDKLPDKCPSCGDNEEAFTALWEARKEKIHERLKRQYPNTLKGI